jgi:hypothetical protein
MSRTLLFVHGINVRGEGYYSSLDLVARKAKKFLPGIKVEGCQWGDLFGARLNKGGVSIPYYDKGGDARPAANDAARALWFLLSQDPLIELRLLPIEDVFGEIPGVWIWQQFSNLAANPEILALLAPLFAVGEPWPKFLASITANPVWEEVVTAVTEGRAAASVKVARAITAAFLTYLREKGYPGLSVQQRDDLRDALLSPLGGPPLGPADWILEKLVHAGGRYVSGHRGKVTDLTSPGVGDIIRYQGRGGVIRNYIGRQVKEYKATIILAHSLGGVAVVDWLATAERPVEYLITMGSQAPYFYEVDALVSRPFGAGLPEFFPKNWLNFFDRTDILSYKGARVFPKRVVDREVKSGLPFPESHSAYFQNDKQVWKKIAKFLKVS